uniref:Uncharacterized protein n=1 Tax=Dicentrarchus labrax TaxID=13489 RepID=A0A8C4E3X8_DICLA
MKSLDNQFNGYFILKYCTGFCNWLSSCVNNNNFKIIFGSGIRVLVLSQNEYAPSYYEVGNKTACLATGFSRYNATKSHPDNLFSDKTMNATLISGDSLYNQVVLLSDEGKCEPEGTQAENCEDTLEPDPMVNLMALIILGLRLLFLKTIVFNVLMTFRLWISQ